VSVGILLLEKSSSSGLAYPFTVIDRHGEFRDAERTGRLRFGVIVQDCYTWSGYRMLTKEFGKQDRLAKSEVMQRSF